MLHSIATVSISGTLEEKLKAIASAGFAGVEIFENDLLTFPGTAGDVARMMKDLGLECTAFQPFRDFEGMPDELRERTFSRLKRKFDVMEKLGAKVLLVCSNVSPVSIGDHGRIIDDFRQAGALAAPLDIVLGYEALAWGRHVWDHRDVWKIVKEVNHPNVGIILDSFHSLAHDIPVESLHEIDPDKIALVQLADAPQLTMDPLSWSRHFRCMPGQGDFRIEDYVGALYEIGYTGPLSLEIFNDRFRAASSTQVAMDGRRSLLYLDDKISRNRGSKILPNPVVCNGVAYIEFSADETEAVDLAKMLKGLGFSHSGQHERKSVARWTQGDISIVINSETSGFARSHAAVHGCSVCAIGLRVTDTVGALKRAEALKMTVFSQPVDDDEYCIPAVRGVGGSLLYFVDTEHENDIWKQEFKSINNCSVDAGLKSVDHIAQAMMFEEMLSWLLYYVSLLDVRKTPQIEIVDPLGVVQSQAIENNDRSLRITMNGSSARQTLSSRFLSSYFGAGVQHIAFECKNIFDAARHVAKSGLPLLEIPALYYDDLEAKFGLQSDVVDELKKYHILYDRDGDAEYFQFYTRAFAKRFFFEIVERRNYDSYGASNASIRLAAQSRLKSDII